MNRKTVLYVKKELLPDNYSCKLYDVIFLCDNVACTFFWSILKSLLKTILFTQKCFRTVTLITKHNI